jgi:ribose transport system substrate-binding protein
MDRRHALALSSLALLCAALPAAAQTKTQIIGVALASDVNPFYIAMKRGIEARAKELGVNVVFVTANDVVAQQVDGILDLISRKVDGILTSPIDSVAVGSAYAAAAKAGIPIISIARHANSPHQSAMVSMDEKTIGADIAGWIIKRTSGNGKIAMITGPSGSATFRNITEGFDGAIKAAPGISVVYRKEAPLTRESGLKLAEDALIAHPDLVAIYAAQDDLALGASQAIAAAGKRDKVVVTGMNGTPPAFQGVKNGALGLTVELNPVAWGRLGVDTMVNYWKGVKPSGQVSIQHRLVDQSNIDQVLPPVKK